MPKTRVVKKDRNIPGQGRTIQVPFKIGGRKSVRSALRMTTQELKDLLESSSTRGRDRRKIQQVLDRRYDA